MSLAAVNIQGISGLVVEYIVAIDVTRVRFPADAKVLHHGSMPISGPYLGSASCEEMLRDVAT